MKRVEIDYEDFKEIFEIDYVARQANGSVLYRVGDCAILASVVFDDSKIVDEDFLPLTVQYIEKSYAAAKFPGGFIKRESKPSDFETLTSRIIDRSIRPLFPKGYRYPTQITVMVLSSDKRVDLQVAALNAASSALYISDLPLDKPLRAIRISEIGGELVVSKGVSKLENSTLDLFLSGVGEELLMIELRTIGGDRDISQGSGIADVFGGAVDEDYPISSYSANEISEERFLEALAFGCKELGEFSQTLQEELKDYKKSPKNIEIVTKEIDKTLLAHIKDSYDLEIKRAIGNMAKSERNSELKNISKKIADDELIKEREFTTQEIEEAVESYKKSIVRYGILELGVRPDGRSSDEIREIRIDTNILPSAHASVLFTRGQTQALVVATLGGDMDAQSFELLNEKSSSKEKFMVHYNFPGFSVGEASMVGAPGRRELGHGNLAKRALESTIDKSVTQTIRLVSEILESNGSSSMATVCGGSLALSCAKLETTGLVAGIAMGLVSDGDRYVVLSDISGIEDHDGDMDFKIAGSRDGITAMQMDIKLGGVNFDILKSALIQARDGKMFILDKLENAKEEILYNKNLPSTESFLINPTKIVDIIGQAGKTIKEIIEKFEVAIDLNRDSGEVKITGQNRDKVDSAKSHIIGIAQKGGHESYKKPSELYSVGDRFKGKVKKIVDFGAFVELPKGGDGLLHISKIKKERSQTIQDVLSEGEDLEVEILGINKNKVELGIKE